VLSRRHRLLVTNAHVADLFSDKRQMLAIPNGTATVLNVEHVWYHPGVRRYLRGDTKLSVRSSKREEGPVDPHSPDLAVLQLAAAADGLELPPELTVASPAELADLFAQPMAILGFPGHDTRSWPALGEKAAATFHTGVISRVTDFHLSAGADDNERQFVQYTASTWSGFSGSPVFLANGHVAAIHNSARTLGGPAGSVITIPHGIRVDCLWELLVHHGLEEKVPGKIDKRKLSIDRWLKEDERDQQLRKAVQLVDEATRLIFVEKDCAEGVDKCHQALKLAPDYARVYYVRGVGFLNYWADHRRRLSHKDGLGQLELALKNFAEYVRRVPSDPHGILLVALVYNNLSLQTGNKAYARKTLEITNKYLEIDGLTNYQRAQCHAYRGLALANLGDAETAARELARAIKMVPDEPFFRENRADFWHDNGRYDLEQEDLAVARRLREKQKAAR
jgi:hypothetical protein